MKKLFVVALAVVCLTGFCAKNELYKSKWKHKSIAKGIDLFLTHSKFFKKQKLNITVLRLDNSKKKNFKLALSYVTEKRIISSKHCKDNKAIAAINGGYFNMKTKKPCAYLKMNGKSATDFYNFRGTRPLCVNGTIEVSKNGIVSLGPAKPDAEYDADDDVETVLTTGPVLLFNGEKVDLHIKYDPRHPRSALGITKDNQVLLVTVDGRTKESAGASWGEMQELMKMLGCTEAINLDGGGSTTLVVKNEVVNKPCNNKKFDNKCERAVSNALIVVPVKKK